MKSIDIKGKAYITVNERLKYFREQSSFEGYQLITEIVKYNDAAIVELTIEGLEPKEKLKGKPADILIKASVINPEGVVVATGHAYEKENSSFINQTSFVENAETIAIGRALGVLGIGIDTSLATFEEVANAINNQKK